MLSKALLVAGGGWILLVVGFGAALGWRHRRIGAIYGTNPVVGQPRGRDHVAPVGPGAAIDVLDALQLIEIGKRADVFTTLEAIFVKRHEHALIDQIFDNQVQENFLCNYAVSGREP